MSECVTTILLTPLFKQNLTVENGTLLTGYLTEMMKTSKHSIYVTTAMHNINRIVLIFKYFTLHSGRISSGSKPSTRLTGSTSAGRRG